MATMTMDFGAPRLARPARATHASTPVRLTARGRLVVRVLVVAMIALITFVVLSFGKAAVVSALTPSDAASVPSHSVVVQPGDTLWSIASRELPGIDPREGIGRIRTLNALTASDTLVAGDVIAVPAR